MIVADSSILVKYISREPGWEKARQVILEGAITIELAVKEVANALWKKVLRGEMPLRTALEILYDLASGDVVKLVDQNTLIGDALQIAIERRITVYDALFIALAKRMGVELATADKRQASAARETGVRVRLLE